MANIICTNCKAENPPDNLFCQSCGTSLKGTKPVAGEQTVVAARTVSAPPPPVPTVTPQPLPVPPPILPLAPARAVKMAGTPISKLGVKMDSWAEILEDAGPKEESISKAFVDEIENLKIEGIRVTSADLSCGKGGIRKYLLVYNGKGSNAAVRFTPLGKDLFITWDLFARRTVNWILAGGLLGGSFVLSILGAIARGLGLGGGFLAGFVGFFELFLGFMVAGSLVTLLCGQLFKDDIWYYFFNSLDDFALDDANALGIIVDNAVTAALEEGTA